MNEIIKPRFPIFIPSKSRAGIAFTPVVLDRMGVSWRMVVEAGQLDDYAEHYPRERLIVLDPAYQRDYETCDDFGDTKSKGSGPARNFIWDLSIAEGHAWHWIMDDNIMQFLRLHANRRRPVGDGSTFRAMEDFVLRYRNVGMAGPHYKMFAPNRQKMPPFRLNRRVYSCNLIRNDIPFRWRGRLNEDTILSLDVLKGGWCTIPFMAFLQDKLTTQKMKGGNTEAFYADEGTLLKARMLVEQHPDVARVVWRYGRWHHHVDYRPFANMGLLRRDDAEIPEESPYRYKLVSTIKGPFFRGD